MDFLYVALAFIQTFMKSSILFQKQADHIFKICHTLQWLPVVPKILIFPLFIEINRIYTYFVEDEDLSPSPMAKLEKSGNSISPQPQEPSPWDRVSAAISGTVALVCLFTNHTCLFPIHVVMHSLVQSIIYCTGVWCQVGQKCFTFRHNSLSSHHIVFAYTSSIVHQNSPNNQAFYFFKKEFIWI